MREWLILSLACLLASCVTTTKNPLPPEEEPKEAAGLNVQLGAEYLRQGRLELAREKLEKAVEQDPRLTDGYTYLALTYDQLGELKKAEAHYQRALRLEPGSATILNLYGAFLCRHQREREAEQYFAEAAEDRRYRTPEAALTNAGVCLLRVPDEAAAEAYFRRALAANPGYRDALWQMSRLSFQRSQALQARAFLQRFAEAGPMTAEGLLLGVRVERALGDEAAAARYAERLREEFPASAEAAELSGASNDGRSE